jgi:hypothetical protein
MGDRGEHLTSSHHLQQTRLVDRVCEPPWTSEEATLPRRKGNRPGRDARSRAVPTSIPPGATPQTPSFRPSGRDPFERQDGFDSRIREGGRCAV